MVVLHPDSPLRCVECGNRQLTVTFSKNPKSAVFEQWFVLVSPIPCRTPQIYVYLLSSAPEKPNTKARRFGLGSGGKTNRRETTPSNRRITPQARQVRHPLRRRRAHAYHASPPSAAKSRRLRALASSVRATADVVPVDRVPPTPSSQGSRETLYLHPALLLEVFCSRALNPRSYMRPLCPLTTKISRVP